MKLKEVFIKIVCKYFNDPKRVEVLWNEIDSKYNETHRAYHNLTHLSYLYESLSKIKKSIKDWDVLMLALFYHDIEYSVLTSNNEVISATLFIDGFTDSLLPKESIGMVSDLIIATESHEITTNQDFNYFLDADIAILGSGWEEYSQYFQNVRVEYKLIPYFLYKKGRTKVLQHFLDMERIFKTDVYYTNFECQARKNLSKELKL